jgi:heme-binding HmuY-like protein
MVLVMAGAFLLLVAALVMGSLRSVELPPYTPTPPAPAIVGDSLVGPALYTIDATNNAAWQRFDFDVNSLVTTGQGWDIGFHRNHVIAGPGSAIADLGPVPFDSVTEAPAEGYRANGPATWESNPAIGKWYNYSFISHLLTSRGHVYAVRTGDGRYAKVELLNYYCAGVGTACLTFRYAYQGDGTRSFH